MADTRQSLTQLQALLADNTTGDISPQDVRDMLISLAPPYGGVSLSGNAAATTISVAGTFVVTNWNSAGVETNARVFTTSAGGRLTYTGTPSTHVHVVMQATAFVTVGASKTISFTVFKNGTTQLPGILSFTTQGNSEVGPVAVHTDVMLATNDYIELWVTNETDTNAVTVQDAYVFAMGMIM